MIAVVGGGMAGCTAAFVLRQRGHEVLLLESAQHLGGRTATVQHDGFVIDTGAVYLLSLYERTFSLLGAAGMGVALRPWKPAAGLQDGTRTHRVRYDRLDSFLTLKLLSTGDKLRLAAAVLRIVGGAAPAPYDTDSLAAFDDGETMEDWSRRRLGDRGHDYVVRPLVEPLFGVGCERLAVPYLHGLLKRVYKVGFRTPAAGMQSMCESLAVGATVRTSATVGRVDRRQSKVVVDCDGEEITVDGVVVATDAHAAAELLDRTADESVLAALRGVQYAAMKHVVMGYESNPWRHLPVEMMLPVGPGDHPAVGIILHSGRTPHGVPAGAQLLSVYLNDRFSRSATDEEAIERARGAVADLLGAAPNPAFALVFDHPKGLALAPPGHYANMQAARRAMPRRIQLAGDYLAHLGVESAVHSGERAAIELSRL